MTKLNKHSWSSDMGHVERFPTLFKNLTRFFNNKKLQRENEYKERYYLDHQLLEISKKINSDAQLKEIFDFAYESLKPYIPFDRLGVAVLDESSTHLKLEWVRSEYPITQLKTDFTTPLSKSLEALLNSQKPRIINNLLTYLNENPESYTTKAIIADGMASSLTFPLVVDNKAMGMIFFSSRQEGTYSAQHIKAFLPVAEHLSSVVKQLKLLGDRKSIEEKELMLKTTLHDLKSPLGTIQGYIDLVAEELSSDSKSLDISKAIKTLKRNCMTMSYLLRDLTESQSITSPQSRLQKSAVLVSDLFKSAIETESEVAQQKNIWIDTQIAPNSLLSVFVDIPKIMRVFDNLINNAIKYSKEGTKVTLRAEAKTEMAEISVIDQGLGIPQTDFCKLFKAYGKASTRPTNGETSTGLGLFICKQIVEAHGGKIWAQSNSDCGTTFTFTLPLTHLA